MLNSSLHRQRMIDIVKALFTSSIGHWIAFKWWTLALFVHGLPRFSTDIDLDLIDISIEQEAIQYIDILLPTLGVVKSKVVWKWLHRWILSYRTESINIKVELNKRVWKSNHYETVNLYWTDCRVMSPDSMATNKLVALHERHANRDLYDTRFFRTKWREYQEDLIKERTWMSQKEFIAHLIETLPMLYTPSTILHQMWEVLSTKQKNRVKTSLLKETIHQLQFYSDWLEL